MRKITAFLAGLLAAVAFGVVAQQSTLGGQSARPRFLSIGVNQAAPATAGQIVSTVATSSSAIINSTSANGSYVTFSRSGTAIGDVGNGGQMGGGMTLDSLALMPRAGNPIEFGSNARRVARINANSGNTTEFMLISGDTVGDAYLQFYESDGTTAKGFVGYGGTVNDTLSLQNNESGAPINLTTTGGGAVQANGVTIATQTSGSFAVTFGGMSSGGTGTMFYQLAGNIVSLYVTAAISGTSNSTLFFTAAATVPVALRPSDTRQCASMLTDNGASVSGFSAVLADGSFSFRNGVNASGWTSSGTKGVGVSWTCTYPLG